MPLNDNKSNQNASSTPSERKHELKKQEMTLQHGILGKIFGSNENVPNYIIGLVTTILVLGSMTYTFIYLFWPNNSFNPIELWKLILPVVTGVLGYIFGSKTQNNNQNKEL